MFKRMTRQEKERRAVQAELKSAMQALHANEVAFEEAQDPFYIEQLTYQHAALMCRCRALCCTSTASDSIPSGGSSVRAWHAGGTGTSCTRYRDLTAA